MEIIKNQLELNPKDSYFTSEDVCFFDIETTGLSPKISSLYLIGAAYIKNNTFHLIQWFADDYISEKDILTAFSDFSKDFSTFVHYNGTTFDIPYIEKKCISHKLPSPFAGKESLDIYKKTTFMKPFLPVADMKLTTMERLVNFVRHDSYSGKDCINIYTDFMQKKVFRDETALSCKEKLLFHNTDDLLGTIACSQLLKFANYQPTTINFSLEKGTLIIQDNSVEFPFDLTVKRNFTGKKTFSETDIYGTISYTPNGTVLCIPTVCDTLYHFYKDYKNYYYLPEEDMAVHKSVGAYVEASHRQKATAATCYTKKDGVFLPVPKHFEKENLPLFQKTKEDKQYYLLLDERTISNLASLFPSYWNSWS